jgi:two-component system CheB/CheR fusion protein
MGTDEMGAETDPDAIREPGLIVIGASAGGVDAVLTVVASLPADFPAPIVIAQHLDPNRRSRLGELLASRSELPVRTAAGNDPLEPGTVYVVPSDHDVEISDHHIDLKRDGAGLSQPSVDRLMSTAARVFGDTLTGVVLSGTGADGAAGAQAIKAYGGTVIVQNPESAKYSGMPTSVPASAVDIVADLDAIGPLLVDLFSGNFALPLADRVQIGDDIHR